MVKPSYKRKTTRGQYGEEALIAALESLKQEFNLIQITDKAAAEMVDSGSTVVVGLAEVPWRFLL